MRPCGGDEEVRTPDPLRARQVLSHLSYTPRLFHAAFEGLCFAEAPASILREVAVAPACGKYPTGIFSSRTHPQNRTTFRLPYSKAPSQQLPPLC